jgi:hypothetical protein
MSCTNANCAGGDGAARQASLKPSNSAGLNSLPSHRAQAEQQLPLERAWHVINHPADRAAASTVEALVFVLRRGLDAVEHPDNQQRLSKLNDEQMREVAARLQKFRPHVAPEWTSTDVEALVCIWSKLRC